MRQPGLANKKAARAQGPYLLSCLRSRFPEADEVAFVDGVVQRRFGLQRPFFEQRLQSHQDERRQGDADADDGDQAAAHVAGEYQPQHLSDADVKANSQGTLQLLPR